MRNQGGKQIVANRTALGGRANAHGLRHQVLRQIGIGIVSGRYPVGMILPLEPELLAEFGVSRTVMREATNALAAKGLIEPRARGGTRVLPRQRWNLFDADVLAWHFEAGPDIEFIRSLAEIRYGIELEAAALAADRRSDRQVTGLMDCVDRMQMAESRDVFAEADLQFHQIVAEASGNCFMQSISSLVEVALASTFNMTSPVEDAVAHSRTVEAHRKIAAAVRDGSGEDARIAMRSVIEDGYLRAAGRMQSKEYLVQA